MARSTAVYSVCTLSERNRTLPCLFCAVSNPECTGNYSKAMPPLRWQIVLPCQKWLWTSVGLMSPNSTQSIKTLRACNSFDNLGLKNTSRQVSLRGAVFVKEYNLLNTDVIWDKLWDHASTDYSPASRSDDTADSAFVIKISLFVLFSVGFALENR